MDNRSNLAIKIDALKRLIMNNTVSKLLPLYIVTEHPKSGGSWVAQMVAEYYQVPFPRNVKPNFESCVMHGHNLSTPFMGNVFCVMRDGRDIAVSSYFHMLFQNDRNSPLLVQRTRQEVTFSDYENIEVNLPAFIEYLFLSKERSDRPFHFSWRQFVRSWVNKDVAKLRYEDLIEDAAGTMAQAIRKVSNVEPDMARLQQIVDKYSFKNQSNRNPGEEDAKSFLRKGQPGDWKVKFSREAGVVFNDYAGKELILLGYEKDSSWVETLPE